MAHITPDNFNMYISSLKLDTDGKTVYGPQLTEVCVTKIEIVCMILSLLLVMIGSLKIPIINKILHVPLW